MCMDRSTEETVVLEHRMGQVLLDPRHLYTPVAIGPARIKVKVNVEMGKDRDRTGQDEDSVYLGEARRGME